MRLKVVKNGSTLRLIGNVPVGVARLVAMVRVTEHDWLVPAGMVHRAGEKLGVAPVGSPENTAKSPKKVTEDGPVPCSVPVNEAVTVVDADCPRTTVIGPTVSVGWAVAVAGIPSEARATKTPAATMSAPCRRER